MKPVRRAFQGVPTPLHFPPTWTLYATTTHLIFRNSLKTWLNADNLLLHQPAFIPPSLQQINHSLHFSLSLEVPVCPWILGKLLPCNLGSMMGLRKVTIVDITSWIRFLHATQKPEVYSCSLS